jgi:hypothetical protein
MFWWSLFAVVSGVVDEEVELDVEEDDDVDDVEEVEAECALI